MEQASSRERKPDDGRRRVSVIVPARNEEACLRSCLESLAAQEGVDYEILVVDDGSTDSTRFIAGSFPQVRVIDATPLPANCSGKCNAAQTGAQASRGEWLLFTDADTVHEPGSLRRAVEEAEQHGAAFLSYSPRQEVHGFWERAVMPVIFAELASCYRPAEVNDSASPTAAANGQYLLIRRATYEAVGGHRAVSGTLLEDVALAKAVKSYGAPIRFRYAGEAVRTRMYRSFTQLCEGWTKNLALLFPAPLKLALRRVAEFSLIAGGLGFGIWGIHAGGKQWPVLALGVAGLAGLRLWRRVRAAHFSSLDNLLALLGLPVFGYLLVRSELSHRRGRVAWKGRVYPAEAASAGRIAIK